MIVGYLKPTTWIWNLKIGKQTHNVNKIIFSAFFTSVFKKKAHQEVLTSSKKILEKKGGGGN